MKPVSYDFVKALSGMITEDPNLPGAEQQAAPPQVKFWPLDGYQIVANLSKGQVGGRNQVEKDAVPLGVHPRLRQFGELFTTANFYYHLDGESPQLDGIVFAVPYMDNGDQIIKIEQVEPEFAQTWYDTLSNYFHENEEDFADTAYHSDDFPKEDDRRAMEMDQRADASRKDARSLQ